jgi:CRP/FNR family transcriptional regulator, global nitrogen regulator
LDAACKLRLDHGLKGLPGCSKTEVTTPPGIPAMLDVARIRSSADPPGRPDASPGVGYELFAAMREADILGIERHYEVGDLVCGEEDQGSALQLVSDGVVKLSAVRSGAKEAVLRLAGPWEPADLPAFVEEPGRSIRAEAFTPCGVVKVPRVFVERAVRENPPIALKLAALLSLEVSRREELYQCLLPRTTEARLARLLPILARDFGVPSENNTVIGLRITHYDLAAMVASTRESVTAAIGTLRRRGILDKRAGTITILMQEELGRISDPW